VKSRVKESAERIQEISTKRSTRISSATQAIAQRDEESRKEGIETKDR